MQYVTCAIYKEIFGGYTHISDQYRYRPPPTLPILNSFVVVGDGAILESVGSFEGVRYNQLPRGAFARVCVCDRIEIGAHLHTSLFNTRPDHHMKPTLQPKTFQVSTPPAPRTTNPSRRTSIWTRWRRWRWCRARCVACSVLFMSRICI